jgi:hypothetical protein
MHVVPMCPFGAQARPCPPMPMRSSMQELDKKLKFVAAHSGCQAKKVRDAASLRCELSHPHTHAVQTCTHYAMRTCTHITMRCLH